MAAADLCGDVTRVRHDGVDADAGGIHDAGMTPTSWRWVADARGEDRGVRVSAHPEAGFVVLSIWRAGVCTGTVRLLADEAAALVAGLGQSLADLLVDRR